MAMLRRAAGALTLIAGLSACAGIVVPTPETNQTVGWLLRVGPQGKDPHVLCASDSSATCVVPRAPEGKPIEGTLIVYLPTGSGHHFNGEAVATFLGHLGPVGRTMKIDMDVPAKGHPQAGVSGLVTSEPGAHRIRITLDESGQNMHEPRRHVIDVPVQVS